MTPTLFRLTLRELMSRRRLALVVALAALPALVALAYRLGNQHDNPPEWTANTLLDGVIITILLPLIALIFGTSALGSEIEDGTVIYLLSKPIARREVIVAKLLAAWLLTSCIVVPATAAAGLIAISGSSEQGIVTGFVAASVFGALAYNALFVMLSAFTSRALFAGLGYVFIWEGIISSLFTGTRYFSIRQGCLGLADLISSANKDTFSADVSAPASIVILAIAICASLLLANRLLSAYQIGESS